ncbi:hypothetical protein D9M71_700830 [compost metagenome]
MILGGGGSTGACQGFSCGCSTAGGGESSFGAGPEKRSVAASSLLVGGVAGRWARSKARLVIRSMAATILLSPLRLISASTSSLAADSATTSHTSVVIGPCQSWVTVLKIAHAASFTKARTS